MRLGFFALTAFFLLGSQHALAHGEHGLAFIKGEGINLSYADHGMAGNIGDLVVFATPLDAEFGVKLTHRAGGKNFDSIFKKEGNSFAGNVASIDGDGKPTETKFEILGVDGEAGKISGKLNGEAFLVVVTSDEMDDHHYINPTFTVTVGSKNFTFKIEDGEACIGCAAKISYVILSMMKVNALL